MIVVIQPVLAVIRDVEIVPSVVVVVADANALSPAGRGQARLGGHIGKSAIVIIVIEAVGRPLACRETLEPGAIDEKNVGPAVVVVVKNRDAGPGGLNDVPL